MAKNLKLTALAAIIVHCTQPTGYRRGGISLTSGKQTLPAEQLTQKQLEAIPSESPLAALYGLNGSQVLPAEYRSR